MQAPIAQQNPSQDSEFERLKRGQHFSGFAGSVAAITPEPLQAGPEPCQTARAHKQRKKRKERKDNVGAGCIRRAKKNGIKAKQNEPGRSDANDGTGQNRGPTNDHGLHTPAGQHGLHQSVVTQFVVGAVRSPVRAQQTPLDQLAQGLAGQLQLAKQFALLNAEPSTLRTDEILLAQNPDRAAQISGRKRPDRIRIKILKRLGQCGIATQILEADNNFSARELLFESGNGLNALANQLQVEGFHMPPA